VNSTAPRRALVLHGGGSAGNAWEIGVVAGLLEGGVDVTAADLVVGTSAGATAAAQLLSAPVADLLAAILDAPPPASRPAAPGGPRPAPIDHFARTTAIIAAASDPADLRRRLGASAIALDDDPDGSRSAQWRATAASRLPSPDWPTRRLLITAIDARSGEPVVFERANGIELADAVAASTSSGLPHRIGEDLYLDGGYRRNENADLAAGFDRVLVLSPFGGRSRHPEAWRMQLSAQLEELEAGGSTVGTVLPDAASLDAFGTNMMDPSRRAPAARAGAAQGRAEARRIAELWG
jgi:NTE family protein